MNRLGLHRLGPLLTLALGLSALQAQPGRDAIPPAKLVGNSPRTAGRLATAQGHLTQQHWSDAIAEYQGILDEAGDDVMPADPKNADHCVGVRRLCQIQLAGLPAAGLRVYRGRFDETAQKSLDKAGRDVASLRRIVDNFFCTRAAETAIDLLGDLAFERGDFLEAEQWWRMLALPASEANAAKPKSPDLRLIYPDPQSEVALIRAKLILAQWFHGDGTRATEELKAFRTAQPKSEGLLAGRQGNYAATLQAILARPLAAVVPLESWPTFAGDGARNGTAARAPRVQWLKESWRASLDPLVDKIKPVLPAPVRNPSEAALALAFFPVIVGDRVLAADSRYVSVFDLLTGKRLSRFDLLENRDAATAVPRLETKVPVANGQRFTLTVEGDRVYVRLGATATSLTPDKRNENGEKTPPDSYLACLRLSTDSQLSLRWLVPAFASDEKEAATFEGSPVVHRGRLYIARTRLSPTASVAQIDCLDAETGVRHWRQDIAAAQEMTDPAEPRQRQHLLTLAGSNVVYCTHAGAVGAVDASTGKRAWGVRYTRHPYRRIEGQPLPRDLAPALYAAGRVYVAPADSDRLFCLDAVTGRTLWESKPIEAVQLLCVNKGQLLFTTGSFPRGIRGVDAATGADIRSWMHPEGGHGELPSMGRGILAGGRLFWPTSEGLRILREDGQIADDNFVPLGGLATGNLAISNGSVVIATDRELVGFVSQARLLDQGRKDAAAQPKSPAALYRLAMAEADAGLFADASKSFSLAANLAAMSKDAALQRLQDEADAKSVTMLLEHVRSLREQGNPEWRKTLTTYFGSRGPEFRGWVELARWSELDGDARGAADAWLDLLQSRRLHYCLFLGEDGCPQLMPNHVAARMEVLRRASGPAVMARAEKEFDELFRRMKGNDPAVREEKIAGRLIAQFPGAQSPLTALERIASQPDFARDYQALAYIHRCRLRFSSEPPERAAALAGLARAYEGLGCLDAASITWQRLSREHGELRVAGIDPQQPVQAYVRQHLARVIYVAPRRAALEFGLPLRRAWEVRHPEAECCTLLPSSNGTDPHDECVFSSNTGPLMSRDVVTGKKRWSHSSGEWAWAAEWGDTVVTGGPRELLHFRQGDGEILWGLSLFESSETDVGQFQMSAGRVFFLQDQRHLFAVDVETGQFLWHRWAPAAQIRPAAPAGKFQPWYHAGRDRLLIQTSLGVPLLLDSHTGKEMPCALRPGVWLRPPLAVSEQHVCLVPDSRHVVLFDLVSGREVWSLKLDRTTTLNGEPPQLLTDGDNLLLGVGRNFGYELERLDVDTGERRWKSPALIRREPTDLAQAAMDRGAVYLVAGHVLEAISLADGKPLWDRPLTATPGGYRVIATKNALLVHPLQAQPDLDAVVMWRRNALLDLPGLVPTVSPFAVGRAAGGAAIRIREEQVPGRFSLLVCDPKDGQLLQRFNFAGRGTSGSVRVSPQGIVVATPGAAWGIQ